MGLDMNTYKVELTEDFIKEAHEVACADWKTKIKDLVPEAFKNQFEVGKWYKLKQDLCNPKVLVNYKGVNSGYGINGLGDWEESSSWSFKTFPEAWKTATDKEVKEALIKEAKKRGLINIESLTIKCLDGNIVKKGIFTSIDNEFHFYNNTLTLDGVRIFESGKWAEIIENPTLKRIQEIEAELKQLKEKL